MSATFEKKSLSQIEAEKDFKEFVQFVLVGTADKVDQKSDQNRKWQFSFECEFFFRLTMEGEKFSRNDNFFIKANNSAHILESRFCANHSGSLTIFMHAILLSS